MTTQHPDEIDIYARVSRASDERMRSTVGQVDDCKGRLGERDLSPGMVHVDNSRSAWNPRVQRPGWDTLMTRLETGGTGGVIVFDLARFSRRPIEGERLITAAERGLLVLDSEDEYDLTTANGKKHFRDQMAGAAYESDRLSTRVKRGRLAKAQRGEPLTTVRAFGFERDGATIREDEAELLRDWTRRLLTGEAAHRLVTEANEHGITTSRGRPWDNTAMRDVLCRHRNAGLLAHNGAVVARLPGEPIVAEADWERVCAMYAARRRGRPPSPRYLCSGLVRCGLCGCTLGGRPVPRRRSYPDGEVAREYWCAYQRGGCGHIFIDQRALDVHMAAFTIAVLSDRRHAGAIEAAARKAAQQAAKLDEQIADAEDLAHKLADRLGRGEITLDRYDTATAPLDKRLADLRAKRAALPDPDAAPVDAAASRAEWEARWQAADTDERRRLLRTALRGRVLKIGPSGRGGHARVAERLSIETPDEHSRRA